MSIDWSKAPEGAEAAHPGNEGVHPAWYRRDVAGLVEQICPKAGIVNWTWMGGRRDFPAGSVTRPANSNLAWNGEGLPPVGTVCEFLKHNSPPAPEGKWTVGDIRYISDCTVIIGGENCEHVHHPRNCSFRPLRTPEQIEIEERRSGIEQMYRDSKPEGSPPPKLHDALHALWAAGYRKQEAK